MNKKKVVGVGAFTAFFIFAGLKRNTQARDSFALGITPPEMVVLSKHGFQQALPTLLTQGWTVLITSYRLITSFSMLARFSPAIIFNKTRGGSSWQ